MSYGFCVKPEEQKGESLNNREDESGTKFVEVETDLPRYPGKALATCYYKHNFAKSILCTEDQIIKRFPKSYKKGDTQSEYTLWRYGGEIAKV